MLKLEKKVCIYPRFHQFTQNAVDMTSLNLCKQARAIIVKSASGTAHEVSKLEKDIRNFIHEELGNKNMLICSQIVSILKELPFLKLTSWLS